MKSLEIHTEYIQLHQALKVLNIIQTGGEAKAYLYLNTIYVNGEIENRRGRKLYPGDVLKTPDGDFLISNGNQ